MGMTNEETGVRFLCISTIKRGVPNADLRSLPRWKMQQCELIDRYHIDCLEQAGTYGGPGNIPNRPEQNKSQALAANELGPPLHHLSPLLDELGAPIGCADLVAVYMRKSCFADLIANPGLSRPVLEG